MKSSKKFRIGFGILAAVYSLILMTFNLTTYSITSSASEIMQKREKSFSIPEVFSVGTIKINRADSAKKLMKIGVAILTYADDNKGRLPDNLHRFKSYINDPNIFDWAIENVEFLAKGLNINKMVTEFSRMPMAYDSSLPPKDTGTNVLFLDGHVEFVRSASLKVYGIVMKI
jgi:prepilin-type processing-associated H-X9-DG protein